MNAYDLGTQCKRLGYSVHYNPFRNKGSAEEYKQWVLGYISISDTK